MDNPFIYDKPVAPVDLINRDKEADLLCRQARGGHNSRLSAPRRYGKTSLVRRVIEDVQADGLTTAYVNFYGVLSLTDVCGRIEEAYRQQLQGPLRAWVMSLIRTLRPVLRPPGSGVEISPQLESDATRLLMSLLDLPVKIYKKTGERTLVVFDEFQDVLAAKTSADGLIRSKIELHSREAAYIFSGSHPGLMNELFSSKSRPFYGQARTIPIGPLGDEDLAAYIAQRFENTRRDIGDVLDPLLTLVRGHPQRALLVAHHLWEATPPGEAADHTNWESALEGVYFDVREELDATWRGLSHNEQKVLAAAANAPTEFLHKTVLDNYGLKRSTAESIAERLVAEGLLLSEPRSALIVDPLFEAWIIHDRQHIAVTDSSPLA